MNTRSGDAKDKSSASAWWPPLAVAFGLVRAGGGVADLQRAHGAAGAVAWGVVQVLFVGLFLVSGGWDLVVRFRKR